MPRPRKGARLWLRPERKFRNGTVAKPVWLIRDGQHEESTGCAADEVGKAERKLKEYIDSKYSPSRKERDIEKIPVADVLSIYVDFAVPSEEEDPPGFKKFMGRIKRLNEHFGELMLSEINGESCRGYATKRRLAALSARRKKRKPGQAIEDDQLPAPEEAEEAPAGGRKKKKLKLRPRTGGARRDLEDLRAAINHHQEEGLHRGIVKVVLPPKGLPRTRWLTRDEAAKLLWTCWRTREAQKRNHKGKPGPAVATKKYPLRHLARFILIGLYMGNRAGAIAAAAMEPGLGQSFVDLEYGLYYRLAGGKRETNKRQPTAPIPDRLLAHMRRWAEMAKKSGATHFVEFNGKPVASVKTAFATAAKKAGLGNDVTPHTLRHTATTWLLQAGVSIWETAGYVGMSPEMVEKVYGHHCPDHLREAANSPRKPKKRTNQVHEKVVVSMEQERRKRMSAS
ncbi:Phage integrase [uncultured Pleomorphomonas sp.]|uniref:Phage integrase n=1 Tax=uncultured Pleomorphomonas sp. TaxID=442121 RepID=A0A212LQC2_9HYPH|nr:tyrosine-type recombinase/integrase [uncultured Pleomorphomonas sp.]SCM79795.1 Phage integrase [uncultured Pleomorphomonas sp.]